MKLRSPVPLYPRSLIRGFNSGSSSHRLARQLLSTVCLFGLIFYLNMPIIAQGEDGTWSAPIDITQPSDAHHPQYGVIQCDSYQRAHIFWADNVDSGDGIPAIFYRNDADGEWSMPNAVITPPGPVVQLRVATSRKNDTLHLLWMDGVGNVTVYHSSASLTKASDARAWLPPDPLVDQTESAALQIDSSGTVHLVYVKPGVNSAQHVVFYSQSVDDGLTWSAPTTVATPTSALPSHVQLEMAVDDRGRIHVGITVQSLDYGAENSVGYARSVDGGRTWMKYLLVQDKGTGFQGVAWIAPFAFGDDEVFLTWHDPRRMYQRSTDGGESWGPPAEIMPLGAAFGGANPIVQDSGGLLHVVVAAGQGVYILDWNGRSWGPPQRIENRKLDPHGQTLAVCQGNRLHAVYYDNYVTRGDLVDAQNRVWWAVRQLNTPRIAPQEPPGPNDQAPTAATSSITVIPQAEATVAPTPTLQITAGGGQNEPPSSNHSTVSTLLIALAPVLILIIGAVFFAWRRRYY